MGCRLFTIFVLAVALLGHPQAQQTESHARAGGTITVTLLGTGNPRPVLDRFGPATLVEAGDERILIDAGRGSTIRLFEAGGPRLLNGLTAVLLTHLHSDHVVGLPDLWLTGWMFGRSVPLEVIGPDGTRELSTGLERAFSFDTRIRRMDEGLPAEGAALRGRDAPPGVVLDRGGVVVTALAVDHGPVAPAYGYRIDFGGRRIVLAGDTRYFEPLIEFARGADVLIHEVVSPEVERRRAAVRDPAAVERIIARHTTPEEAGRIFAAVKPRLAVYSHIVPTPATAADLVPPTRTTYNGPLEVGYDLMQIIVSDRIDVGPRPRPPQ